MSLEFLFDVPKHNTLKLGKILDLETLDTDTYKAILLSTVSGLVLNDLDIFDASMQAHEVNTANYERTTVGLQLTETTKGYQVAVIGSTLTIPISNATVQGVLIIKESTGDILAACLDVTPTIDTSELELTEDLTILFKAPIWEIGQQVCTG